jgi:5-methylcytosine-specific restriction endonuclease McrA
VSVPPTERQAAIAAGERHYFTGVPCKHGHVAKRRTSTGACVECHAELLRERYKAGKDRKAPERVAQFQRKWRKAHPERVAQSQRKWRAANGEKIRAYDERRLAENPEKVRAICIARTQTRRARGLAAEGRFTADDVSRITKAQGGKCACCRKRHKLTVDHIVPLVKGGSNWPSNLQMLCRPCNSSKSAKDPIRFMQERGMLL